MAALLVAAVLLLAITRPRGLPVWAPALVGAAVALSTGLVTRAELHALLGRTWNATLALVGLMLLSATLEANGAFRAAAHRVARASAGAPRRLFVGLCLLTALTTLLVANDGAILILTPIVADLADLLGLGAPTRLALLFSTGFLCDALSIALPTTNLTNLLALDVGGLSSTLLLQRMAAPTLAVLALGTVTLGLLFRRALDVPLWLERLGPPPSFSRRSQQATAGATVLLVAGYGAAAWLHLPLGVVVALVAAGLALVESLPAGGLGALAALVRSLPLGVVLFANAMFLLVTALFAALAPHLEGVRPPAGPWGVFAVGGIVSLLCDVGNNLPVYLVSLLHLEQSPSGGTLELAALIGANIGSKLTPIGSLATLLWLELVRRRGLEVGWGRYVGLAALPTVVCTLAALLLLGG